MLTTLTPSLNGLSVQNCRLCTARKNFLIKSIVIINEQQTTCFTHLVQYLPISPADAQIEQNIVLMSFFVKANLNCLTPVESIYYSANNLSCCYHCGSHIPLPTSVNEYPMCSYCRDAKRNVVLKRFSFKNDRRCFLVM